MTLIGTAGQAVIGPAHAAGADGPDGRETPWALFQRVGRGDCNGLVRGNTVKWWQTLLWADGTLSGSGAQSVDGVFGDASFKATLAWEQQHHLGTSQTDGCANDFTYRNAQARLDFVRPGGGAPCCPSETWMYPGSKRNVTYIWNEMTVDTGDDWFWEVNWIPPFRVG
jgi:hypothetical protein